MQPNPEKSKVKIATSPSRPYWDNAELYRDPDVFDREDVEIPFVTRAILKNNGVITATGLCYCFALGGCYVSPDNQKVAFLIHRRADLDYFIYLLSACLEEIQRQTKKENFKGSVSIFLSFTMLMNVW